MGRGKFVSLEGDWEVDLGDWEFLWIFLCVLDEKKKGFIN